MVRRRRRWRKRFACGHRGFGQVCRRCTQPDAATAGVNKMTGVNNSIAASRSLPNQLRQQSSQRQVNSLAKRQWQQQFAADPIDLRHLPQPIVLRARRILALLDQGVAPGELQGKRFGFDRTLLRLPISYRYRLLCRWQDGNIVPLQVLSHEAYNAIARHRKKVVRGK